MTYGSHNPHVSHHGMGHSDMHRTMPKSMNHPSMHHGSMDHAGQSVNSAGVANADMMMHDMSMTFHGGYYEILLFEFWKISTISDLITSMIGIMIIAALYEGLKSYREHLFSKMYKSNRSKSVPLHPQENVVDQDNNVEHLLGEVVPKQPYTMLSWVHTVQTFLHTVQIMLSYFQMLIFMTYNVWLCFAVAFGAAIGYFLFGCKKSVIGGVTEHCH